jgi:methionine sulfoxide reductase catalytic subunit
VVGFDAAHAAVHYPPDRRFSVWIKPSVLALGALLVVIPVAGAWIQTNIWGLPTIAPVASVNPNNLALAYGFPVWVRYCHFLNVLFVMLLIRSGLSILADHPRMYFNDHCTPGSEWIKFTPITVPQDRLWTAKDDARYISPLLGTPGYRHTVGIARAWHFINIHGFIVTGIVFATLLFATDQWKRIVPTSPVVLGQAWSTWVHYVTFHLPPEPDGFYGYNALQQIAYFAVFLVFGPAAILTGVAMSPAVVNRFPGYPRRFGGRQSARSIHFLTMIADALKISTLTLWRKMKQYELVE